MKKLIALTLLFITFLSYGYDTHEEIDALAINKVLHQLLKNAYPDCKYSFQKDEPKEFEFLVNDLGTPECAATIPVLQESLDNLKTVEHNILAYKISLNNKKIEAKNLYQSLRDNYHQAAQLAGVEHISNPDAWIRDNCERVGLVNKVEDCLKKLDKIAKKLPDVVAKINKEKEAKLACDNLLIAMKAIDTTKIKSADIQELVINLVKLKQCGK